MCLEEHTLNLTKANLLPAVVSRGKKKIML